MKRQFLGLALMALMGWGCGETDPGGDLVDNRSVYDQDALPPLTVRLTADNTRQLDYVLNHPEDIEANVPVILQEGTFAASVSTPNATLSLRGASTRDAEQRSFKIKLLDKTNPWRGHSTVHLNKHIYDHSRIRNKLSFDLFTTIPHMTSLRTRFIHLFLNGEDMGLFTQIESAKKEFLKSHGLDPRGTLYKAVSFEFAPLDPAVAKNPAVFERMLESKANPNPAKVVEMVNAVNDESQDIDDVIERYFWRDNYVAWLASNVLMANTDTNSQNFYLYSPSGSRRWYFLPWDYDGAWGYPEQPGHSAPSRADTGIAYWWAPALHQRFLRKPKNAAQLDRHIRALRTTLLTDEKIAERLAGYRDIVRTFISQPPDLPVLQGALGASSTEETVAGWSAEVERVGGFLNRSFDAYVEGREWPMPIWLGEPQQSGSTLAFEWDESFDLQGDSLTYDFDLSRTPAFASRDLVEHRAGLRETRVSVSAPPAGEYYFRVIVRDDADPARHWQYSMDVLEVPAEQKTYFGVRQVTVR